jgi:hypothetical protein
VLLLELSYAGGRSWLPRSSRFSGFHGFMTALQLILHGWNREQVQWQAEVADAINRQKPQGERHKAAASPTPVPASDSPSSLAGRYSGGGRSGRSGNGDGDCDNQWKNARDYCSDLMAMPRNSSQWKMFKEIWGGNLDRCINGQVDERCGGNCID